jgi:hypothetical protein
VPAPVAQKSAVAQSVEALKADPTVRMQAVPKDDKAGPQIAAKQASPKKLAADSKRPQTALLRPAMSDADTP